MSTFSREYLQNLPAQKRQEIADTIAQDSLQRVLEAATSGETSYLVNLEQDSRGVRRNFLNAGAQVQQQIRHGTVRVSTLHERIFNLTQDDIIAAFYRKFPGCDISYEETWTDVSPTSRVLKKGIKIDWSPS